MHGRNFTYTPTFGHEEYVSQEILRFNEQFPYTEHKNYAIGLQFSIKSSFSSIVDEVINILQSKINPNWTIEPHYNAGNGVTIFVGYPECQRYIYTIMITINVDTSERDPEKVINREFNIDMLGDYHTLRHVYLYMKHYEDNKLPSVDWHFKDDGRNASKKVILDQPKPYYDEFYPWIKGGVKNYFDSYRKSDNNIILLLGDPGTGKSSFIRNFIFEHRLNTMVTYEEDLLASDGFFLDFLTDDNVDLLVVEDADLMLTDRENDGNKVMSKLLNVSDGLIKVIEKKIIFTANITQVSKIDSALRRPGRCFDTMEFRSLNYDEAKAACKVAGITVPEDRRNYTLAELFNPNLDAVNNAEKLSLGFH